LLFGWPFDCSGVFFDVNSLIREVQLFIGQNILRIQMVMVGNIRFEFVLVPA